MAKIEQIPTAPAEGGYGEMDLELRGDVVIVTHHIPPAREVGLGEIRPARKEVLYVPLAELWRLMVRTPGAGFEFEGLSLDELRGALDFARFHGWPK